MVSTLRLTADWASQLGLAPYPLFGGSEKNARHFAMLDGIAGSFVMSHPDGEALTDATAADWAWSSLVRHHVTIDTKSVSVRSVASKGSVEKFTRASVEGQLENFFQFLEGDRRLPRQDVVEHITSIFLRHRAHLAAANLSRADELSSFLTCLGAIIEANSFDVDAVLAGAKPAVEAFGTLDPTIFEKTIGKDHLRRLLEELEYNQLTSSKLNIGMAVRHAGGMLFQETHSRVITDVQPTLFGLSTGTNRLEIASDNGVYFTPPGLARTLAELTLRPLLDTASIRILDPACGSGAFLCEAIRALHRASYKGKIYIEGSDISPYGIAMARFAVGNAIRDWPDAQVTFKTEVKDFITAEYGVDGFDVILMNPPFQNWESMGEATRSQTKNILGDLYRGRPDLSMVFILKAAKLLKSQGVLGTLMPVGLLSTVGARKWREALSDLLNIDLLSVLGNHSLFRNAMVNVGALIGSKRGNAMPHPVMFAWASEKPTASSEALRRLRMGAKSAYHAAGRSAEWNIYALAYNRFKDASTWIPRPNALGELADEIAAKAGGKVSDLFEVKQGARAGLREAFILSGEQYAAIPAKERGVFRKLVDGSDIIDGKIHSSNWIFYPNPDFESLDEVKKACPTYFERYLEPNLVRLSQRAGVANSWELTRPRRWQAKVKTKIVSKMFAYNDGFAVDGVGDHVIVQGYGWLLKQKFVDQAGESLAEILSVYTMIFNSDVFLALLKEHSTNTAGGQWDLSPKYVDDIPLPNLIENAGLQERRIEKALSVLGRYANQPPLGIRNELAAYVYGVELEKWPIKTPS